MNQTKNNIWGSTSSLLFCFLISVGLYFCSRYSYLLFHSLSEFFSIAVAVSIFFIAWNTKEYHDNAFLLFIGIAYLFIGCLDMLHTLAYPGMGVMPEHASTLNLPVQIWIVARYTESISIVIGLLIFKKRVNHLYVTIGYSVYFTVALLVLFLWDFFPPCFIEGKGLTPFKVISEYIIIAILLVSVTLFYKMKAAFDQLVYRYIIASIFFTILSELAFTFYIDFYGLSNLIGHYCKILSFFLIYLAITDTGLRRPYDLLFRNLKTSEEALKKAQQIAGLGNWEWDISSDTIQWSEEACRILEFHKLGCKTSSSSFFDAIHSNDQKNVRQLFDQNIRAKTPFSFEHRVMLSDQQERFVREQGEVLCNEKGIATAVIGTIQDITQAKAAEQERINMEIMLRKSHKMEAIGTMAGGIAHNFNNLLGTIIGYTDMAQEEVHKNSLAHQYLDNVQISSGKAKTLVEHIMAFSHQNMTSQDCFKPDDIIQEYVDSIDKNRLADVHLNFHIEKDTFTEIPIDSRQFKLIIANLFSNALDAMAGCGGTIKADIKKIVLNKNDVANEPTVQPGNFLQLTVSDSGQGISPNNLEHIYDPFFSTKEVAKGGGIGLSVVHGIVRNCGGMITVESKVGKGTSFHLFFPVIQPSPAPQQTS